MKLRLRPGFEANVKFFAMSHNLLYHLAHLVHFYGVDDKILGLVFIFICSNLKAAVHFFNPAVENIRKPYQHRG